MENVKKKYLVGNEAVQVLRLDLILFRAFRYHFVLLIQTSSLSFTVSLQRLSS